MGGGASSLIRLRKAIIIRSYNLRKPDETVDQQFRRFAVRGEDGVMIISLHNIRNCLEMESKEYDWIDHLFLRIFGGQVTTVSYSDFIKFLESGKTPESPSTEKKREGPYGTPPIPPNHINAVQATPSLSHSSSSSSYRSVADASSIRIERLVRSSSNTNNNYYNNKSNSSSRVSLHADRDGLLDTADDGSLGFGAGIGSRDGTEQDGEEEEEVLHINLSSAVLNPHSLPESVKLHSHDGFIARSASRQGEGGEGDEGGIEVVDDTYTVIVHPSRSANKLSASDSPAKPLWRKRETVRQERTVHYTTIDASGEQQELIEKETTQSEVLHMECKETGQFAHRETTQYEQLETFNAEVVAETKGAEEYVHLKSLEDEYHYMESTMPNKEGDPRGEGGEDGQQQQQQHDGEGEGEGMYGEPVPHSTAEEAAAAQAAMEAEYAEAYHLYHQKCREQQERGEAPSEQDEACADMFRMSPRQPPPPFSDDTHQAQGFGSGYSSNNNTGCEGPGRSRGKGSGRSEEEQRAREAFAFAEDMEDLDEPPDLPHQQHAGAGEGESGEEEEAEQSQLFGEHIPFVSGGGGAGSNFYPAPAPVSPTPPPVAAARQGSGLRGKEYLFEPPSDGAEPFVGRSSSSSSSPRAEGLAFNKSNNSSGDANTHHQLPPRIPTTASPSDASSTTTGADAVADAAPAATTQHDDYLSRTSSYESLHEID